MHSGRRSTNSPGWVNSSQHLSCFASFLWHLTQIKLKHLSLLCIGKYFFFIKRVYINTFTTNHLQQTHLQQSSDKHSSQPLLDVPSWPAKAGKPKIHFLMSLTSWAPKVAWVLPGRQGCTRLNIKKWATWGKTHMRKLILANIMAKLLVFLEKSWGSASIWCQYNRGQSVWGSGSKYFARTVLWCGWMFLLAAIAVGCGTTHI